MRGANEADAQFGFTNPTDVARERNRQAHERGTQSASSGFEGGAINSGMAGGLLAMVVAVIWFVVGWMGGVIFFYPPILFIIGLVSLFNGLSQGPNRR